MGNDLSETIQKGTADLYDYYYAEGEQKEGKGQASAQQDRNSLKINDRIEIYIDEHEKWCPGFVASVNQRLGQITVTYRVFTNDVKQTTVPLTSPMLLTIQPGAIPKYIQCLELSKAGASQCNGWYLKQKDEHCYKMYSEDPTNSLDYFLISRSRPQTDPNTEYWFISEYKKDGVIKDYYKGAIDSAHHVPLNGWIAIQAEYQPAPEFLVDMMEQMAVDNIVKGDVDDQGVQMELMGVSEMTSEEKSNIDQIDYEFISSFRKGSVGIDEVCQVLWEKDLDELTYNDLKHTLNDTFKKAQPIYLISGFDRRYGFTEDEYNELSKEARDQYGRIRDLTWNYAQSRAEIYAIGEPIRNIWTSALTRKTICKKFALLYLTEFKKEPILPEVETFMAKTTSI